MGLMQLGDLLERPQQEATRIDQAFVELAGRICFSVLEREFATTLPSSYPNVSLEPSDLLSELTTGFFSVFYDYQGAEDDAARSRIASTALGPPEPPELLPREVIVNVDGQALGAELVIVAEHLCSELLDRPIIHLLATELQFKASDIWNTPIPAFCVIDSKYGQLRASGIFSASHALAFHGDLPGSNRLLSGLYQPNPHISRAIKKAR